MDEGRSAFLAEFRARLDAIPADRWDIALYREPHRYGGIVTLNDRWKWACVDFCYSAPAGTTVVVKTARTSLSIDYDEPGSRYGHLYILECRALVDGKEVGYGSGAAEESTNVRDLKPATGDEDVVCLAIGLLVRLRDQIRAEAKAQQDAESARRSDEVEQTEDWRRGVLGKL